MGNDELDQIIKNRGFFLSRFKILANIEHKKERYQWPRLRPSGEEGSEEPNESLVKGRVFVMPNTSWFFTIVKLPHYTTET